MRSPGARWRRSTPPALSAAIHAFLIADIRGYTAYTQRFGDNAAAQLSTRFADIARSVFERWDGRLVEVRGDEVLGVFASARQAVLAAGELHARYEEERLQHPDMPIGIGVGLDLGEAVPVGDGFRGAALNRSARLCSLAGPGETLVSPGIVYVAPQIEGVEFRARGQEQLKGFAEPVPILLAAPGPIVDAASAPRRPTAPWKTTRSNSQQSSSLDVQLIAMSGAHLLRRRQGCRRARRRESCAHRAVGSR